MLSKLLITFLVLTLLTAKKEQKASNSILQDGYFIIVVFLPSSVDELGNINTNTLLWSETVKFTVAEFNKRSLYNLSSTFRELTNETISVGYLIYDACEDQEKAMLNTLNVFHDERLYINSHLRCPERNVVSSNACSKRSLDTGKVLGFVLGLNSSCTYFLLPFLGSTNLYAISFTATQVDLANDEKFPDFARTTSSDLYYALAVAAISQHFNWTYIAVLSDMHEICSNMRRFIARRLKAMQICVGFSVTLPEHDIGMRDVINSIREDPFVKAIVFVGDSPSLVQTLREAKSLNLTDAVWIWLPSSISPSNGRTRGIEESLLHASFVLRITPYGGEYTNFMRYFWGLRTDSSDQSVWLQEYFQSKNASTRGRGRSLSLGDFRDDFDMDSAAFVYNALQTYFSAIDYVHLSRDNDTVEFLKSAKDSNRRVNIKYFVNKTSISSLTGAEMWFDSDGNINTHYLQLSVLSKGSPVWKLAGFWNNTGGLHMHEAANVPYLTRSQCMTECPAGFAAIPYQQLECCLECLPCPDGYVKPSPGIERCQKCGNDTESDRTNTLCVEYVLNYSGKRLAQIIIILLFSSIGVFVAILLAITFVKFRRTPLVKSSDLLISMVQLLAHAVMYVLGTTFLFKPSAIVCSYRMPAIFLLMTLNVSLLLVKSERLLFIFKSRIRVNQQDVRITRAKEFATVMISLVINVGALFATVVVKPIVLKERRFRQTMEIFMSCDLSTHIAVQLVLSAIISGTCFLHSFRARNLPGVFNETKHIATAVFAGVVILMFFIPLRLSTEHKEFADCLAVLTTNTAMMGIIFLRKAWTMWLSPELNKVYIYMEDVHTAAEMEIDMQIRKRMVKISSSQLVVNSKDLN